MLPGGNAELLAGGDVAAGAAGAAGATGLGLSSILRSDILRPGSVDDRIKGFIAGGSSRVLEREFPSVSGVLPSRFE